MRFIFFILLSIFIPFSANGKVITIDNDGAILWFNSPNAVYFQGNHKRTYFAYLVSDFNIKLAVYDHDLKELKTSIINSFTKADDHNAPTLHIIRNGQNKGRILVFFNSHTGALNMRHSDKPEIIAHNNFCNNNKKIDDLATYSSVIELDNGEIYLFYTIQDIEQNKRVYGYRSSVDGGETWRPYKKLIDFGEKTFIYAAPASYGDGIIGISWAVWSKQGTKKGKWHFPKDQAKNLYYIESKDSGKTWKNEKIKKFSLPISAKTITPLIETPENECWVQDVRFEGEVPHILFIERKFPWKLSDKFSKNTSHVKLAKINPKTKEWSIFRISESASVVYPAGARFHPQGVNKIYISRLENELSKIFLFSKDPKSDKYISSENPIEASPFDQLNPQVPSGDGPFNVIWMESKKYKDLNDFNAALKAELSD